MSKGVIAGYPLVDMEVSLYDGNDDALGEAAKFLDSSRASTHKLDARDSAEMVRALKLSFGVVINRADLGNRETRSYCDRNRIKIFVEIPDDRQIAEAYSRGEMVCEALPDYQPLFEELLKKVSEEVRISVG